MVHEIELVIDSEAGHFSHSVVDKYHSVRLNQLGTHDSINTNAPGGQDARCGMYSQHANIFTYLLNQIMMFIINEELSNKCVCVYKCVKVSAKIY